MDAKAVSISGSLLACRMWVGCPRVWAATCSSFDTVAVLRLFGLNSTAINLEGPAEGPGGEIPMSAEPTDPTGQMSIGSDAGALEALALQDAEPELDLVEPRRVQGKECELDLSALPVTQARMPGWV